MNNERKNPPKHKFGVFHKKCSRVLPLQGMTNGAKQMSRAPVTVELFNAAWRKCVPQIYARQH